MIAVKKVDLFPPRHLFSLQKKPKKGAKRKGDLLNSQKATSCVTFPRKGEEDLFTLDRTLRDHVSTVSRGYFRVPKTLPFRTRLSARPFLRKCHNEFYLHENRKKKNVIEFRSVTS